MACLASFFCLLTRHDLPSILLSITPHQQSSTIQEVWTKRAQANINDSHNEYLSDLTRIASTKYIPTEHDILISRVRTTTQVTVEKMYDSTIEGIEFEVYDAGQQRSERRKWMHYFDNVDAVICVAALSEYDQCLAKDKRKNCMIESLNIFESVVKNTQFADCNFMLYLNKKDIFAEKIMYSNIQDSPFFSDYAGPPKDFDQGVLYFIQRFEEHLDMDDHGIHVTCATDTNNMEFVFTSNMGFVLPTCTLRR